MIFMTILAIISNTSETGLESVQNQMFLLNCPLPTFDAEYNSTNVTIEGFAVVLDSAPANVTYGGLGTVFRCYVDPLSSGTGFTVIMTNKDYQAVNAFGFPDGWFAFIGDFIGSSFQKISNLFVLIGFFVTPTNFNILGYTLSDIGTIALMVVIAIYAICYIAIGAVVYKIISPFSGVQ